MNINEALNTSKLNRIQKQLEIKLRQLKSGSNTDSAELNKTLLTIEALQAIAADPSLVDGKVSGINNKFLNMLRQEQLKLRTEILKGDPDLDIVLSSYMRIKSLLRLTTDKSLYNTRVNENNNRVNITRPAWPTSAFAQDLKAMYGHLMKPGKEDKESYEEAKEYLQESNKKYEAEQVSFKEDADMKYVLEGNLFDNIRAKQERIAKGSGEKMKKPNQKGYPKHLERIAKEAALNEELFKANFAMEIDGRKTGVVDAKNEDDAISKIIEKFNIDVENIKDLKKVESDNDNYPDPAINESYTDEDLLELFEALNLDLNKYTLKYLAEESGFVMLGEGKWGKMLGKTVLPALALTGAIGLGANANSLYRDVDSNISRSNLISHVERNPESFNIRRIDSNEDGKISNKEMQSYINGFGVNSLPEKTLSMEGDVKDKYIEGGDIFYTARAKQRAAEKAKETAGKVNSAITTAATPLMAASAAKIAADAKKNKELTSEIARKREDKLKERLSNKGLSDDDFEEKEYSKLNEEGQIILDRSEFKQLAEDFNFDTKKYTLEYLAEQLGFEVLDEGFVKDLGTNIKGITKDALDTSRQWGQKGGDIGSAAGAIIGTGAGALGGGAVASGIIPGLQGLQIPNPEIGAIIGGLAGATAGRTAGWGIGTGIGALTGIPVGVIQGLKKAKKGEYINPPKIISTDDKIDNLTNTVNDFIAKQNNINNKPVTNKPDNTVEIPVENKDLISEASRNAPHVIKGKYIRLDNGQVIEPEPDYWDDYVEPEHEKPVKPEVVKDPSDNPDLYEFDDKGQMRFKLKESSSLLTKYGVEGYNKPKRTPGHKTKSHLVVAKKGDKIKVVRFGAQGVSGSPKKDGESESYRKRRQGFVARHKAQNPSGMKDKFSALYWANKVKW